MSPGPWLPDAPDGDALWSSGPWRSLTGLGRREPFMSAALVATEVLSGLAGLGPPLALVHAAYSVVRQRPALTWAVPLVVVTLLACGLRAFRAWLSTRLTHALRAQLATSAFEACQRLATPVRAVLPDGSVSQLVTDDAPHAAGLIATASSVVSSVIVLAAVAAILTVLFPPAILGLSVAGVAVAGWVAVRADREVVRQGRLGAVRNLDFVARVGTLVSARMTSEVRLLGLEGTAVASFREALARAVAPLRAHLLAQAGRDALLGALLGCWAVAVGVVAVAFGDDSRPAAVLWVVFLTRALESPLATLIQARSGVQVGRVALARLAAVESLAREAAGSGPAARSPRRAPDPDRPVLVMEQVGFSYPDLSEVPLVLRPAPGAQPGAGVAAVVGLDLRLEAGQSLAVVGSSGAGKSTLAQLATGLLVPDQGRVVIDGQDTRSAGFAPGGAVALVSAEPLVAEGSVLDNVWMAVPEAPVDDAVAACTAVGLDLVTDTRTAGLGSGVGAGGALLSSGERQRLALARALLRRPQLLILDEATTALDVNSERRLWAALRSALPRAGFLVVSHRASTVLLTDSTLVLDAGTVVEHGDTERVCQSRSFRSVFGIDDPVHTAGRDPWPSPT